VKTRGRFCGFLKTTEALYIVFDKSKASKVKLIHPSVNFNVAKTKEANNGYNNTD
jgi:hypothetical protein